MAYADKIFKDNIRNILENGVTDEGMEVRPKWADGKPAHTKYITQVVNIYDIEKEGIPILTIRPIAWRTGLREILWIYQDKSNNVDLLEQKYGVKYWRAWANEKGNLGKSYGYQMAKIIDFPEGEFTQIDRVIHLLKTDPMNRRIMTNMLNLEEMKDMTLPPCCYETLWTVRGDKLDMTLIQRSGDIIPAAGAINVTQYAMLLCMIAATTGYTVGKMTHFIQNLHIYDRHIPIAEKLLSAMEYEQPSFTIFPESDFNNYKDDSIAIIYKGVGKPIKNIPIAE